MKKAKVYIAGKLNDSAVGYIKNCHNMIYWAHQVRLLGCAVYVPCLDFLEGLVAGSFDYEDYFENSQPWLLASDSVFVCPGWETSEGTKREIKIAEENNIPVIYKIDDLWKWSNPKEARSIRVTAL